MAMIHCSASFFYRDDVTGDFHFHMHELSRADYDKLPRDEEFPELELKSDDGKTCWTKSAIAGDARVSFYTHEPPTVEAT